MKIYPHGNHKNMSILQTVGLHRPIVSHKTISKNSKSICLTQKFNLFYCIILLSQNLEVLQALSLNNAQPKTKDLVTTNDPKDNGGSYLMSSLTNSRSKRSQHHIVPGSISDYAMDLLYNAHTTNRHNYMEEIPYSEGQSGARSFVGRRSDEYMLSPEEYLYTLEDQFDVGDKNKNGKLYRKGNNNNREHLEKVLNFYERQRGNMERNKENHLGYDMRENNFIHQRPFPTKRDDLNIGDYAADMLFDLNAKSMGRGDKILDPKKNRAYMVGKRSKNDAWNSKWSHFDDAAENKHDYFEQSFDNFHQETLDSKLNQPVPPFSPSFIGNALHRSPTYDVGRPEKRDDHSIGDYASDMLFKYANANKGYRSKSDRGAGSTFVGY